MRARHLTTSASLLALTLLGCGAASAFDRTTTLTTPAGTYSKSVDAGCADGRCTRNAEITGPQGGTVSRATDCGATWRFYGCADTITGPNGNSVSRHVVGRRRF